MIAGEKTGIARVKFGALRTERYFMINAMVECLESAEHTITLVWIHQRSITPREGGETKVKYLLYPAGCRYDILLHSKTQFNHSTLKLA